mmetsp:Transcript_35352/g.76459  ORF Transcript_35352/g.76459 Transcript_35352/m.76459 type:complete len:85 (-) Transcript_35352:110-364(-)
MAAMASVSHAKMTLQSPLTGDSAPEGLDVSHVAKEVRKLKKVLREIEALEDRSSGGEQLLDCQLLKMQRKTEILDKLADLTGWS